MISSQISTKTWNTTILLSEDESRTSLKTNTEQLMTRRPYTKIVGIHLSIHYLGVTQTAAVTT